MAHELTLAADGRYEMAFTGETPWHGLGQNVMKGASIGVWLKEAGMDWEARTATPMFSPVVGRKGAVMRPVAYEDHKIIYRGDTGVPLSIVGRDYKIVQPREILEFFRKEVERGDWYIHTAGTLRGGRKLWAMATAEGCQKFIGKKKDMLVRNILVGTSLDGSMRTTVLCTDIAVVCANTLRMALDGANAGDRFEVSHRSIFDAKAIKKALGIAMDTWGDYITTIKELADTPIKLDEAQHVLEQIFVPQVKKEADTSWMTGNLRDLGQPQEPEMVTPRGLQRVLDLFGGEGMGADMSTRKGTKWGLLNAVTQYVDHELGRTPDTRIDNAWFGKGQGMKVQAYKLLVGADSAVEA